MLGTCAVGGVLAPASSCSPGPHSPGAGSPSWHGVLRGLLCQGLVASAVPCFPGLQCVCQLCEHTNFTCQTEGACWASVMLTNGREEVVKSCVSLPELNAQVFCHSSKNITKTECCYTDFCNNITLRLPLGECQPSSSARVTAPGCSNPVQGARLREPVLGGFRGCL